MNTVIVSYEYNSNYRANDSAGFLRPDHAPGLFIARFALQLN